MAKKLAFDKVLFTVVLVLLAGGLVMVYSASMASGVGARLGRASIPSSSSSSPP